MSFVWGICIFQFYNIQTSFVKIPSRGILSRIVESVRVRKYTNTITRTMFRKSLIRLIHAEGIIIG